MREEKIVYKGNEQMLLKNVCFPRTECVDHTWYAVDKIHETKKAVLFQLKYTSKPNTVLKFWVPRFFICEIMDGFVLIHFNYNFKFIKNT